MASFGNMASFGMPFLYSQLYAGTIQNNYVRNVIITPHHLIRKYSSTLCATEQGKLL